MNNILKIKGTKVWIILIVIQLLIIRSIFGQDCNQNISIIIPNDGSVDNNQIAIPCKPFMGIYEDQQSNGFVKKYEIKPIDLIDTIRMSDSVLYGKLEEGIELPKFMISGLEIQERELRGKYLNKMYFPFEMEQIWIENIEKDKEPIVYYIYAKGNGKISEREDGIFESIIDYQLWIRKRERSFVKEDYLLYKTDIKEFQEGVYEGGVWIYWIGHLNDDDIPEIIMKTSNHYAGWEYQLLLSKSDEEGKLYKVIKVGGGSSC